MPPEVLLIIIKLNYSTTEEAVEPISFASCSKPQAQTESHSIKYTKNMDRQTVYSSESGTENIWYNISMID